MTRALVYLHGFNSAPQSVKGELLRSALQGLSSRPLFHLPQLPPEPSEAMVLVTGWIDANVHNATKDLTLIGSSLGGFYATWLAERYGARAIVINPAVRPFASLEAFLGPQRNLYTGESYMLTLSHLKQMEALRIAAITRPVRYLLLVRSGDELLDWREAVRYYGGAWQYVGGGGDHGWADFQPMLPTVLQFAAREVG